MHIYVFPKSLCEQFMHRIQHRFVLVCVRKHLFHSFRVFLFTLMEIIYVANSIFLLEIQIKKRGRRLLFGIEIIFHHIKYKTDISVCGLWCICSTEINQIEIKLKRTFIFECFVQFTNTNKNRFITSTIEQR